MKRKSSGWGSLTGSKLLPLPATESTRKIRVDRQKSLPVTYHTGGKSFADTHDHHNANVPTVPLEHLSADQWKRLTIRRIRAQKEYSMFVSGAGLVSKTRAIKEIQQGTVVGKLLVEIEKNHILQMTTTPLSSVKRAKSRSKRGASRPK